MRFVPPSPSDPYYEVQVFETGRVQTRAEHPHDLFNALAWLAFPRTKARINAMHAAEIPKEGGRRGRLRDMLTIFDEGGALVACPREIEQIVRDMQWRRLFLERASDFRILVFGHAVMEQSLAAHPGITCKVIFVDPGGDPDAQAARWLTDVGRTPKDLPPLPVFGYPGWHPDSAKAAWYDDERFFRPLRRPAHPEQ